MTPDTPASTPEPAISPDDPARVRYRAFISYSHADKVQATWLHRALETYPIPRELVGSQTRFGPVPRRLTPIFRDQDELSASGDLRQVLVTALEESMFLIVICSPRSAKSPWVGEEILTFKRMHGDSRILALIVGGEPYASQMPGREEEECFPAALRFRLAPDGSLSDTPAEPLAADIRPEKDGRRLAKLKLLAGLTGLRLDDLAQRETQRRVRRLIALATASTAGMVLAGGLALYANAQRIEAETQKREAERQSLIARKESAASRASADFLVGTFQLTNPATENPRTVTALTILAKGAKRLQTELSDQPAIAARLLATVGKAYNNLGLAGEAQALLEQSAAEIKKAGPDGGPAALELAYAYLKQGRMDAAMAQVESFQHQARGDDPRYRETLALSEKIKAQIYLANGDPKAGLKFLDRALVLYRSAPDTPLASLAGALNQKGFLLSDDGQFAAADASLLESLALRRRTVGDQDMLTGQAWLALALNDLAAGHLSLAEARIDRALAILRRVLDPDNPILADAISTQGQIFQGEHKAAAAVAALSEAISVYRNAYKRPHYQIGITLVYLALAESERGHTAAALAALADAKHNYDVSYGKLHPNHGDLLVNKAQVLARAGRRAAARKSCADGIDILNRTLGAEASFTKANVDICHKL